MARQSKALRCGARTTREPFALGCIVEEPVETPRQRRNVTRREQNRILPVMDELRDSAGTRCHHGLSNRAGLRDNTCDAFSKRGVHNNIHGLNQGGHFLGTNEPGEVNAVMDAKVSRPSFQGFP